MGLVPDLGRSPSCGAIAGRADSEGIFIERVAEVSTPRVRAHQLPIGIGDGDP